jgi:hypothetical protein
MHVTHWNNMLDQRVVILQMRNKRYVFDEMIFDLHPKFHQTFFEGNIYQEFDKILRLPTLGRGVKQVSIA